MNGPVIFLSKGTTFQPSIRGKNLVTRYVLPKVSCVIPDKSSYMDDDTWVKVVKVVAPGIRKMNISNLLVFFPFILYISNSPYMSLQIIFKLFVIFKSGGHSSHIMDSSIMSISLMPSKILHRRGSRLASRRLLQALSIERMINSRRIRTRLKQVSSCIWHGRRFVDGSTSGSS